VIEAEDREFLAALCLARAGLMVDPAKAYLIDSRIAPVARREGFPSPRAFVDALRAAPEGHLGWALVEALGQAESEFFRDRPVFERLVEEVLPELARERAGAPVRVWNAACGAGQEIYSLAMMLADAPAPPHLRVRAFTHALGDSPVGFFAAPAIAARHRRRFPQSLDGAPVLLPSEGTSLRSALDHWFEEIGVRPRVVAECEDSALLKTFGRAGLGLVPTPVAIAEEATRMYGLREVGRIEAVRERFYAISVERRLKHPAVLAIAQAAGDVLTAVRGAKR